MYSAVFSVQEYQNIMRMRIFVRNRLRSHRIRRRSGPLRPALFLILRNPGMKKARLLSRAQSVRIKIKSSKPRLTAFYK